MNFEQFINIPQYSLSSHVCITHGYAIELSNIEVRLIGFLKRGVSCGAEIARVTGISKSNINRGLRELRANLGAKNNIEILMKLEGSQIYPLSTFK